MLIESIESTPIAVFLLRGAGEGIEVPFSLRENGVEVIRSEWPPQEDS
jgi:hypothetical protein